MNAITTQAEAISIRATDDEGRYEYLALRDLRLDERNVRKDPPTDAETEELADLIDAQGLVQNLTVVAYDEPVKGRGKDKARAFTHGVIAGGRRLAALQLLVKRKCITLDEQLLCRIVPADRALAVSAAENSGRKAMSTADTIVAFADMVRAGAGVEALAVAFHLSPLTVQRRLKLANVSPKLFALFRAGGLTLDQLMALALTDDHDKQEAAWSSAPAHDRSPRQLRALIAGAGLSAAVVRFVGLPPYEAAGGQVLRDLFSDAEEAPAYVLDPDLMMRLATEKLDGIAQGLRAGGAAWVETFTAYTYTEREQFVTPPTTRRQPTAEQASELAQLRARADVISTELEALYEQQYDDEDDEDQEPGGEVETGEGERTERQEGDGTSWQEKVDALEEESRAVELQVSTFEKTLQEVLPEVAEKCGALVYIDNKGQAVTERPVMRKADATAARRAAAKATAVNTAEGLGQHAHGADGAAGEGGAPGQGADLKAGLSDRLCHQLTAHRTRALQALMLGESRVALAALVHPLLTRLVYEGGAIWESPSNVKASADDCESQLRTWAPDLADSPAEQRVQQALAEARALLPVEVEQLLPWLLAQPEATLTQLLTLCSALSLNAINGSGKHGSTGPLAKALGLQMDQWWSPTASSYLGSVSKALIGQAVREAGLPDEADGIAKLKKGEAAAQAETLLAGRGWLPAVLRG
jgi:ParB family chromosome partitioning protein